MVDVLDGVACEWIVNELGPPPDAILRIPPPPMPSFIDWDGWMKDIAADIGGSINQDGSSGNSNGSDAFPCHWCHLIRRSDAPPKSAVGSPASDAEMAMEETWFFVILASSLMLLLGVLLSGLVYWTLNRKTMKGTWDFGSFFSESGSILMGGCSSPSTHASGNEMLKRAASNVGDQVDSDVGVGGTMAVPQQATAPSHLVPPTRALWAGVKTMSEGNHYTITHAQPFEQRANRVLSVVNRLAPADEDSAGYTTLQPTRVIDYPATDNQIYYCCTDLMVMSPMQRYHHPRPSASFKVTSLDDSVDPVTLPAASTNNSLYVNMSPVHPFRHQQVDAHCASACCPLRNGCHAGVPVNALAIGRSSVSPALHLHPIAAMSLGENWRKV